MLNILQLLGSAYLLNGSADYLNDIYEDAVAHDGHESWEDSPSEIALHDYRDFLGLREYQRAWVDFFEDQLVTGGDYEWSNVVQKFLFEEGSRRRPNPISIIHSIVGGLGHPLIHLGYAYELNSREVAMEAMGLAATCYDAKFATLLELSMGKVSNSTANPLTYSTSNPFEVFARVNGDKRLDGLFDHADPGHLDKLFSDERLISILIEHWSAWKITDPKKQFEDSQLLASTLLTSTAASWGGHGFDFFLVHILTTSHAVRIIIPMIEAKYHILLVREWFLIALAVYIAQARPIVDVKKLKEVDLDGKTWRWAEDMALVGKHRYDAHYVKAIRAMKEAAAVWGDEKEYYLRSAVKFAGEFDGWKGFGNVVETDDKNGRRGSIY